VDRKERMDAEIKKVIDGRTKEFREKLAKLAYEKIKAQLVPEKEPLKGYPHNESVELQEKEFVIKVDKAGPQGKDLIQKITAKDQQDAVKQFRKQHPRLKNDTVDVRQLSTMKMKGGKYVFTKDDVNEEVTISLDESVLAERLRLRSPNKTTTIDIDYIGSSSDINQSQREYNIKIKKTGRQMADVTGKKGDIVKFLQGDAYAMDDEDIKDLFPELLEGMRELESMFGLRATDWRKLVKKHKRDIDAFQKGRKDLPKNVEDELLAWAMDNGEVRSKDDAEDFIDIVLNAHFEQEGDTLNELNARYGLPDMKQSKDPKVKRELAKLNKVQYGSLQYIRQYKEVEAALDASLPAHKRKK